MPVVPGLNHEAESIMHEQSATELLLFKSYVNLGAVRRHLGFVLSESGFSQSVASGDPFNALVGRPRKVIGL